MKERKWFALLMALVLVLGSAAGCKQTTPAPTAAPAEPTAKVDEPVVEEPTVDYDVEIYGESGEPGSKWTDGDILVPAHGIP